MRGAKNCYIGLGLLFSPISVSSSLLSSPLFIHLSSLLLFLFSQSFISSSLPLALFPQIVPQSSIKNFQFVERSVVGVGAEYPSHTSLRTPSSELELEARRRRQNMPSHFIEEERKPLQLSLFLLGLAWAYTGAYK